jgi:hypothetical protein
MLITEHTGIAAATGNGLRTLPTPVPQAMKTADGHRMEPRSASSLRFWIPSNTPQTFPNERWTVRRRRLRGTDDSVRSLCRWH